MRPFVLSAALLLASLGAAQAQDAAAGEKVFAQCKACHQIGENAKNAVGPVLNGVIGRPGRFVEGYSYSAANKNSGITWTEATFREYIKDPKAKVPGTKMILPGSSEQKSTTSSPISSSSTRAARRFSDPARLRYSGVEIRGERSGGHPPPLCGRAGLDLAGFGRKLRARISQSASCPKERPAREITAQTPRRPLRHLPRRSHASLRGLRGREAAGGRGLRRRCAGADLLRPAGL